jgi:hypothetical protein
VEAEDFGGCVAGENSPQAAEILVDSSTEDTKEHKGKTKFSHELTGMSAICFCGFAAPKICAGREGFLVW